MPAASVAKQALVFLAFAATARLADDPAGRVWLERLWDATGRFGMDGAIPGVAPYEFPVDAHHDIDSAAYRVLASRQGPAVGITQALVFATHDVLGVMVVLAPEPESSWQELDRELLDAAAAADCDLTAPPPAVLGTASLHLGVLGENAAPPDPHARGWTRVGQGFLIANAEPDDQTSMATAATATATGPSHRCFTLLATAEKESDLDRWTWSSARLLPPFARYLLHSAKLRDQLAVYERGRFGTVRRKVESQVDELMRLDLDALDLRRLLEARSLLTAEQVDADGLFTSLSRLRTMARTVDIALANLAAAVEAPDQRRDRAQIFSTDQELGRWLLTRIQDSEEYLTASLARADRMNALVDSRIEGRRARYQQQLTLLQASIIGAAVMALTVVQALQYRLPVLGPVQAPFIATVAGAALVLPGAIVRWIHGVGDDAPLRNVDIALLAVPGAAIGWLISSLMGSPIHPWWPVSLAGAAVAAIALPYAGHLLLRRLRGSSRRRVGSGRRA